MKNHEAQLPSNQTLNDEIKKKLYKRIKNKKITIKIMRIKIKIKKTNQREITNFQQNCEIEKKNNCNKRINNKKNKGKSEKIIYHQFRLNNEIKS